MAHTCEARLASKEFHSTRFGLHHTLFRSIHLLFGHNGAPRHSSMQWTLYLQQLIRHFFLTSLGDVVISSCNRYDHFYYVWAILIILPSTGSHLDWTRATLFAKIIKWFGHVYVGDDPEFTIWGCAIGTNWSISWIYNNCLIAAIHS